MQRKLLEQGYNAMKSWYMLQQARH